MKLGRLPGQPLRTAAVGGLAFTVLYLVHRTLQGSGPVSSAPAAAADYHSVAVHRTGLVWRWLGVVGLVAAALFLVGSVFSVLGQTPEGSSSLVGVGGLRGLDGGALRRPLAYGVAAHLPMPVARFGCGERWQRRWRLGFDRQRHVRIRWMLEP